MKRHLVLTSTRLHVGGLERNVLQLAQGLDPDGYEVTLLGEASPEFEEALGGLERPVRFVPFPRLSGAEVAAPLRAYRTFRSLGADLVHAHDVRSRLTLHPVAKAAGAATVSTCHISPFYYPDQTRARLARYVATARLLSRATDRFIFVSDAERQTYVQHRIAPLDRTAVVYNGISDEEVASGAAVDPDERARLRASLGVPEDGVLAAFVGRLAYQKGLDFLVDAAPQALRDAPSLHFLLVGDGPLRADLEAAAHEKAPGRFHFVGLQPREAVTSWLGASDLFVLPSRFECFPYATLEALAAGLPCVVTDVGGNAEAITDGTTGRIVLPEAPGPLAQALAELATDADLRQAMSAAARERAASFSVASTIRETEAIYASLAG